MKTLSRLLFLVSVLLFVAGGVTAQDMASFRKKAEDMVKAKNPQWKIIRQQERGQLVTYMWGEHDKSDVILTIFYGSSEQEAAEKMKKAFDFLSVGPGKKIKGYGEEAYLWTASNGSAGIRFRKENVYVDLSGSSLALVEDLAKKIANHVSKK